jgi:phosphate-selective porin OprO/OprP
MIRKSVYTALLAGSLFAYSTAAMAQDAPAEPDQSDAAADAAIAAAQPVDELQAKIELLQAQVEALQESLETVKSAQAKAVPSWKGAPLFEDKESGWSFKPRGRLMYDLGWVESPEGIDNGGLGFSNEVRRARRVLTNRGV